MERLFKIALVLGIGYLVVTQFLPFVDRITQGGLDRPGRLATANGDCIFGARDASRELGNLLNRFGRPPVDLDAWADEMWEFESELTDVNAQCSCPEASCSMTREAISDMRALLEEYDRGFRGSRPPANAAADLIRIDDQLAAARSRAEVGD